MPCFGGKKPAPAVQHQHHAIAEGMLAARSLADSEGKEKKSWLSRVLQKPVSAGSMLIGHHGPPSVVHDMPEVLREAEHHARSAMAEEESQRLNFIAGMRRHHMREAQGERTRRRRAMWARARAQLLDYVRMHVVRDRLERVLESKPDDHNALAKMGELQLKLGDPRRAETALLAAIAHGHASHGGGARICRLLGKAQFGIWHLNCTAGAHARCVETYARAFHYLDNISRPELRYEMAQLHEGFGSCESAVSLLDVLLTEFPGFQPHATLHHYARLLFHMKHFEPAIAIWRAQLGNEADGMEPGVACAASNELSDGEEEGGDDGALTTCTAPHPYLAPDLRFQVARALELLARSKDTLHSMRFEPTRADRKLASNQLALKASGVPSPLGGAGAASGDRRQLVGSDAPAKKEPKAAYRGPLVLTNGDTTAVRMADPTADGADGAKGKAAARVGHGGHRLTGSALTAVAHRTHAMTIGRHRVEFQIAASAGHQLCLGICCAGHDESLALGSASAPEPLRAEPLGEVGHGDAAASSGGLSRRKKPGVQLEGDSWCFRSGGAVRFGGHERAFGASFAAGDRVGMEVDVDEGTITFFKNGESLGVAFDGLKDAWRGRVLLPAVSLKEVSDKVSLVGGTKLPAKDGPLAPANLAYIAFERYFYEEVQPKTAEWLANHEAESDEDVFEDEDQTAKRGDTQDVGTGGAALALLGAKPVRPTHHKYKMDWRHDSMTWRAKGLEYRAFGHWELALDAFSEAVQLQHLVGAFVSPGIFEIDPIPHDGGLAVGTITELLLLQCDAMRHFMKTADALIAAKRALSFDRYSKPLRKLLSSLFPASFGPIFRRQNLAATALAAGVRGMFGRTRARRFLTAARFSSGIVRGAFERRKVARGNAAALVGEMWNAAFAPRAFAATWLRGAYWQERERLRIFGCVLTIQHVWRSYAMYLRRFCAAVKVEAAWRSHRVRYALMDATRRAQFRRVNVDGPRRVREALRAKDSQDGWGSMAPAAPGDSLRGASAAGSRPKHADLAARRRATTAAAASASRLVAHQRLSKGLTMEERKQGHFPRSFTTDDGSSARKSKKALTADESRLLVLGIEEALVGVPVLTKEALTVELPAHLARGGKMASLLRRLKERGRYRTVYEWIPAKLFLRRFAPTLMSLPLQEAARRLREDPSVWCEREDKAERLGLKWRRKGTRTELDFDWDESGSVSDEGEDEMGAAGTRASEAQDSTLRDADSAMWQTTDESSMRTTLHTKAHSPNRTLLSRTIQGKDSSPKQHLSFSTSHLRDRTLAFQTAEVQETMKGVADDAEQAPDEVGLQVSFADKRASVKGQPDERTPSAAPVGATVYTVEGRKPLEVSSGYGVAVHGVKGIYRSEGYQTSIPGLNDPVFRAHRYYVVKVKEPPAPAADAADAEGKGEDADTSKAANFDPNASAAELDAASKLYRSRHGHLRFELRRRPTSAGGGALTPQWRPQTEDRTLAPQNRAQFMLNGTFDKAAYDAHVQAQAGGGAAEGVGLNQTYESRKRATSNSHKRGLAAATTRSVRGGNPLDQPANFKPGVNALLARQTKPTVGIVPDPATGAGTPVGAIPLAIAKGRQALGRPLGPLKLTKVGRTKTADAARASAADAAPSRVEIDTSVLEADPDHNPAIPRERARLPRPRNDFGPTNVDYRLHLLPHGALGRGTVQTEVQLTSPLGKGTAMYRMPGWGGKRSLHSNAVQSAGTFVLPPVTVDGRDLHTLTMSKQALRRQHQNEQSKSHGLVSESAPTPQFTKVSGGMDREELSRSGTQVALSSNHTVT